MNFDSSFPKRVAAARQAVGMTQAELASAVGVVQRQIAAYEGAEAKPREKVLVNLAAALGTTVAWLTTGQGEGPDTTNIKRTVTVREVPLLTHVQVMGIGFDFDNFIKSASASEFVPAPPDAGEFSFAYQVSGSSMESPGGVSFPDGTIVIVDPEVMPEHGDFGLFILNDDDMPIFKQYVIDQGIGYLRSLNPQYPMLPATKVYSPIGTVIASQLSFKEKEKKVSPPKISISRQMTGDGVSGGGSSISSSTDWMMMKISAIESKLDLLIKAIDDLKKQGR